jgi:cytochrome c oxidase subunit 1
MNGIFAPMFLQGMAGFHRRAFDGGAAYEQISSTIVAQPDTFVANVFEKLRIIGEGAPVEMIDLNIVTSTFAWILAIAQVPFVINLFASIYVGKKISNDNPWDATTLEWATPTPPPHGNFLEEPVAYRGPYEYSVPGADTDFTPQFEDDPAVVKTREPEKDTNVGAGDSKES